MHMSSVLEVKNLTKIYRGNSPCLAVDKISFDLKEAEILGLLGPNGSGKTTTIQMLLGTLAYTSGSVRYFGKEFSDNRSEILQHVSFASAYASLPWNLTIGENLEVFGYLYGFDKKESHKRFDLLLDRFGILEKKNKRVSSLSAGQVTRLMLVKAFFIDPKVVLLDEPTASLDPDIAADICSFLLEQREKIGLSILFTSHKMAEVMNICDRSIFLKNGKIIANDTPKKLVKSIASFALHLDIVEGLQNAIILLEEAALPYTLERNRVVINLDEEQIAPFLHKISLSEIIYSQIKIEEPSLEDFFLHIAKKSL